MKNLNKKKIARNFVAGRTSVISRGDLMNLELLNKKFAIKLSIRSENDESFFDIA